MEFQQRHLAEFNQKFGDLLGEFWLGNVNIRDITTKGSYMLRIEISYPDADVRHVDYTSFSLTTNYTLQLGHLIKKTSSAGKQLLMAIIKKELFYELVPI